MKRQMKRKEGLLNKIMKGLKSFSKRKLFKNKIMSMILILIGYITMHVFNDCTVFILMLMLGLPVFFARKNVIQL